MIEGKKQEIQIPKVSDVLNMVTYDLPDYDIKKENTTHGTIVVVFIKGVFSSTKEKWKRVLKKIIAIIQALHFSNEDSHFLVGAEI